MKQSDVSSKNKKWWKYKFVARKYSIWHENEKEDAPVRTNGGHRPLFTTIKMAALQILTRLKLSVISFRFPDKYESVNIILPIVSQVQKRWGSYRSSSKYTEPAQYSNFEVSKDPQEWAYVERLLKSTVIPMPPLKNKVHPSGWKPPICQPNDYPYYVQRTKNYMQPVYLCISYRGQRKITCIRKIHGDIWALQSELKSYMAKKVNKPIGIRINELAGEIQFRGDYVNLVRNWLDEKGF